MGRSVSWEALRAALRARPGAVGACPAEERVFAFYAGSLAFADEDEVRAHLVACAACREVAADAREFLAAIGGEPGRTAALGSPRWRTVAALAAGLVLLAGGALLTRRLVPRPQPSAAPAPAPNPWRDLPVETAEYVPEDDVLWRDEGAPAGDGFADAMEPYARGDFAESARRLGAYLARRPQDTRARFYHGVTLLLLGRDGEAVAALEPVTGDERLGPEARWYLALAHLRAGESKRARPLLQGLAEGSGPRRAAAQARLGELGARER
jgi:hypothetical protein